MNEYMFLSPEQSLLIRKERVHRLEEEHYNALLMLEENPGDPVAVRTVAELERRITHHVNALTGNDAVHQSDAVAIPPELLSEVNS